MKSIYEFYISILGLMILTMLFFDFSIILNEIKKTQLFRDYLVHQIDAFDQDFSLINNHLDLSVCPSCSYDHEVIDGLVHIYVKNDLKFKFIDVELPYKLESFSKIRND